MYHFTSENQTILKSGGIIDNKAQNTSNERATEFLRIRRIDDQKDPEIASTGPF